MKFLVPNYCCLQNPWLWGYRPQIPVLSVLCPQLNLLNPPPPPNKIPGYATALKKTDAIPNQLYWKWIAQGYCEITAGWRTWRGGGKKKFNSGVVPIIGTHGTYQETLLTSQLIQTRYPILWLFSMRFDFWVGTLTNREEWRLVSGRWRQLLLNRIDR
jgi:hypothetical protein